MAIDRSRPSCNLTAIHIKATGKWFPKYLEKRAVNEAVAYLKKHGMISVSRIQIAESKMTLYAATKKGDAKLREIRDTWEGMRPELIDAVCSRSSSWSIRAFSEFSGMSTATICKVEKMNNPKPSTIDRYVEAVSKMRERNERRCDLSSVR